jgi:hypothetical protein
MTLETMFSSDIHTRQKLSNFGIIFYCLCENFFSKPLNKKKIFVLNKHKKMSSQTTSKVARLTIPPTFDQYKLMSKFMEHRKNTKNNIDIQQDLDQFVKQFKPIEKEAYQVSPQKNFVQKLTREDFSQPALKLHRVSPSK